MITEATQPQADPGDLPVMPGTTQTPNTPTFAMLRALGVISMVSGLLVAMAYELTAPIIAEGRRIATAVSYTHLDVYKRQAPESSSPAITGSPSAPPCVSCSNKPK